MVFHSSAERIATATLLPQMANNLQQQMLDCPSFLTSQTADNLIGGASMESILSPLAIKVAVACLLAQGLLYCFFRLFPQGSVWSNAPSYTAHQVIVFPLMTFLVWKGTIEWFFCKKKGDNLTAQDRVLQGSDFSDIVLAIMLWDIPVTILTPKLRNTPMMIHHVAMVVTAALSLGVWSNGTQLFGYYAPFYFGVTEVSTLPLVTMDLCKSKNLVAPSWVGPLFAFLFLTVRAVYFPIVSVTQVLPDILDVAAKQGIYPRVLYFMALLNVLFTILQLYWGSLVVQGIIKLIQGGA